MKEQLPSDAHNKLPKWMKPALICVGLFTIAWLLLQFIHTVEDHMSRAHETSRDPQWQMHSPTKNAEAAAILQGKMPSNYEY